MLPEYITLQVTDSILFVGKGTSSIAKSRLVKELWRVTLDGVCVCCGPIWLISFIRFNRSHCSVWISLRDILTQYDLSLWKRGLLWAGIFYLWSVSVDISEVGWLCSFSPKIPRHWWFSFQWYITLWWLEWLHLWVQHRLAPFNFFSQEVCWQSKDSIHIL